MRSASAVLVVVVLALASSSCAGSFVASEAEPQHWLGFKPEAGSSFDYTTLARHFDFRGRYLLALTPLAIYHPFDTKS